MKKIFSVFILITLMLLLNGCGSGADQGQGQSQVQGQGQGQGQGQQSGGEGTGSDTVVLKVGHTLADTSHYQVGLEKFKELVETRSNGQIKIEIYPNGQLGGEREMIEGLGVGSLDMVLTSTGPMSGFVPEVTVVDLPFLFRDAEHAHKVLDGEIGQELLNKVSEKLGVKTLAWWENGFRHITNNVRPIVKPEDVKGLKIRTMENDIHMDTFAQLGAQPTPMAYPELFTALQQGVVDAQENPLANIVTSRFYEVQKYVSLTGHFYNPTLFLIAQNKFDALTPEQQQIIQDAAIEAGKYERDVVKQMDQDFLQKLKDLGVQVEENPDLEAFKQAVQPVYEKYEPVFGKELIDRIRNTQ